MNKIKNIPSALFSFWVLLLTQASTLATNEEDTRVNSSCPPGERAALLTLKAGFVDPKDRLSSWEGHDCCSWSGVTCSKATGHVVKLDLSNTYILNLEWDLFPEYGPNPDYSHALGGEIRSSLLSLRYLNYLDLSCNDFSFAEIPHFIGTLKELRYLNLSASVFGGRIPPQFGNLSNLQHLDLSSNFYIDGHVPSQLGNLTNLQYLNLYDTYVYSNDVAWLAHLTSLKHLDLSGVNLSSSINWEQLGMLPHLQALYLSYCEINETSFSLSDVNFTKLSTFHLTGNEFSNPQSLIWVWNMTCLRSIDISDNNFDSRLPHELRNMNSIEELYLDYNNLTDMKSSDMQNLTNLKILKLSENQLTRDITKFMEGLSLYGLQLLDLSDNNFYGNLSGWIGHMTGLINLLLGDNNLSGPIPLSIGKLTQLIELDLDDNNFNGPIPLSIRRLTQLIDLDLSYNNFHGVITEKYLSRMTKLKTLYLFGNSLSLIVATNWLPPFRLRSARFSSCRLGPKFPEWLKWQTNILVLDMSNTNIADEVPVWFWRVFSKTIHLDLSKNNLSGFMPESLEFMSTTHLFLSGNQFQGLISRLSKSLFVVDLSKNAFSGFFPSNWENINLEALNLRQNSLNGSIPQFICQLKNLQFLDLSRNFFVGNIPYCGRSNSGQNQKNNSNGSTNQSFLKHITLKSLFLSYNNLSGEFSKHLKYFSSLIILDLENNNFFGSIPPWIAKKLPSLILLSLGSNMFNGTIPNQLFELEKLQMLNLSNNNLNGMIPSSMRTLMAMVVDDMHPRPNPFFIKTSPNLAFIIWTITEVYTKGQVLELEDNILYYTSLDLSRNNLLGNIPEEIGALEGLINLNLSRNKLSGFIPRSIGNLQLLESLDFSNNELSGSIPSSMADLTFLSHLNMSYNNLSGRIPSGHQLQTLNDPSIYEGNNGLCGFPLPIECFESKTTSQSFVSHNKNNHEFYVGAIIGFAVGAWMVYGIFIFSPSWRVTYFLIVDNMYDRLYVFVILKWARSTWK
ncbi:LRR receptor-like serine/threonine-protein kinase GSO2 [Rhynchospora pubera]|uniref:LRR receptor-like serine/threonine-protein kinase GSO2 n=1 Tax=Rhynchospora pubera TaxID=906938 RepID=A0AAV8C4S9_9POAL|nr:LRR receptor-like serine/threonine-protein kinase GSO2 [Rhynchospora pubera]